jgi:hypothetical protein
LAALRHRDDSISLIAASAAGCEHPRSDFFVVMKREDEVGPTRSLERAM